MIDIYISLPINYLYIALAHALLKVNQDKYECSNIIIKSFFEENLFNLIKFEYRQFSKSFIVML